MGWMFTNRPKGISDKDWFAKEWPSIRLLATHSTLTEFYAAAEQRSNPGEVFALVVLKRSQPGYHNFGYKGMDETMGPGYHGAPAKILDLLTPTDSEWANQWRDKCRETIAHRAKGRKVKAGTVVKFVRPVNLTGGYGEQDTFIFVKRNDFTLLGGTPVRLTGWRDRDYEVVTA